jgi:tetratricopeptide (TPR) repeat protein
VAIAAAVIYLVTLNPWLAARDPQALQAFSRATNQEWYTESTSPVFHLMTSLFRLLPESIVPIALNIFSALCAAVVLALLARSVALLPQDRTHKQREREQSPFGLLSLSTAWIPVVLAVTVCGLQLTFWENATNLSAGMLDLVLFAYSVRCLLEYRISQREKWLLQAAFVYVAGMADTWVLIALFPAFVIAMIWIRGHGFFQLRFLARLFLCVLAGLLFYLYFPLLHLRTGGLFWQTLKSNAMTQIQQVIMIYRNAPHHLQFLLVLTSLLPILVIGIRWRSQFGDSSPLGTALTTWIFHLTHAVLLGVCIWAAFDPGFSIRDEQGKFPFLDFNRDQMLPLYFLGALSIGYLAGYFLLVFKLLAPRGYRSEATVLPRILNGTAIGAVCTLLVLAPAGLLYKNLVQIKVTNGSAWQQYAAAATANLPPQAIILSDRSDTLLLAQAWLARDGKASNFVFLETDWLRFSAYHRFQKAKHPEIWPDLPEAVSKADIPVGDAWLMDLILQLSAKVPVYYLHPSFGNFFERFYQVPHGLAYELQAYPTNTMSSPPPLPEAVYSENETFWNDHEAEFRKLLPFIAPPGPGTKPTFRGQWMQRMHIPFETNQTAWNLGLFYSRSLNALGVLDQRLGRLDSAARHFAAAQEFSPGNAVAAANLDFNRKLRAGERIVAESPESFEEHFGNIKGWERTLEVNGLFDTATGCLAQGIIFTKGRLVRQGAEQYDRVLSLAPHDPLALLWLARTYIVSRAPEKAYPLIAELRAHANSCEDAGITPGDILSIELAADYTNKKMEDIRPKLEQLSTRNMLDAAVQTCISFRDFTNALFAIEKRLGMNPDDVPTLVNDGFARLQLNDTNQASLAIVPLTRALSLQPTNSDIRLLRAAAYLESRRLEDATLDYQTLEKTDPTKEFTAEYALGEIALQKGDTAGALRHFLIAQAKTPANSPLVRILDARIKNLKGGTP